MPDKTTTDADKLQKLGQRLREGYARQHPVSEKSLETVRGAVREQWEKDQEAKRVRATQQPPAKTKEPKGPSRDR